MKNLNQLVNAELTRSIKNYDKLSDFVYKLMYLDKNKHNIWVVTKQQQLTVMTDNPYLGTQLRYQQEVICKEINKQFLMQLKNVKIKIIPPNVEQQKKLSKIYEIGDEASAVLSSIANEIDDDELKAALLRLTTKDK